MSEHTWAELSRPAAIAPAAAEPVAQPALAIASSDSETSDATGGGSPGLIDLTRKIAGAILQRANQDAEKIRREAAERGYREGMEEARRQSVLEREAVRRELVAQVGVRLQEAESEYDESWNRLESHVEENLTEALMLLAGESLGKLLREQPKALASAMALAIGHLDARQQIKFRLHPEDLQNIVGLSELPFTERAELHADPTIEQGGFLAATEGGEIDGRWSARTLAWREQLASGA